MGKELSALEEKLNLLVSASATLVRSIHLETPGPAILGLAQQLQTADACAIWRIDAETSVWGITASIGLSPAFTGRTAPGTRTRISVKGRKEVLEAEGIRSLLWLPLNIAGRPGALAIYYRKPYRISRAARRAAVALAHFAAVAIETSELLARNRAMTELALGALREREERMQMAMDVGRMGVWEWDIVTGHMLCCERFRSVHGFATGEWDGRYETFLGTIHPDDRAGFEEKIARALRERGSLDHEFRICLGDGSERWIATSARVISDSDDRPVRWIGVDRDVTWRRRLEHKVREAQQTESIALLAAGVAHKFNNLLTSIMGNASLAGEAVAQAGLSRDPLDNIVAAARRAAYLTRQLLAYSGQGMVSVRRLNLSAIAREAAMYYRATAPANVFVELDLAEDPPLVEGDPALLEQALMNVLINASEAIGASAGRITVRTGNSSEESAEDVVAGRCVYLEVSDTGCGMDAATQARIFDPFFSTKFIGRGLGLAAVSGIMRRHGGSVQVHSEPGKGSTFRLLLPALCQQVQQPGKSSNNAA